MGIRIYGHNGFNEMMSATKFNATNLQIQLSQHVVTRLY